VLSISMQQSGKGGQLRKISDVTERSAADLFLSRVGRTPRHQSFPRP